MGPIGPEDGADEFVMIYGQHVVVRDPGDHDLEVEFLLPKRAVDGAVGDFDGDGGGDVAVLLPDRVVYLLHRAGDSTYEQREVPLHARGWRYLEVGEFDGRPGDEVVLVGRGEVVVRSLDHPPAPARTRGKLRAAGFRTFLHGLPAPDPAVGDLDGDGDDDVALFSMTHGYKVLRQEAPGRLELGPTLIGGPATDLADIDGDGDLDGICCSGGGGGPTFPFIPRSDFPSEFMFSPNRGDGTFEVAWSVPGNGAEFIAGGTDLDGDGDVDLVAGRTVIWNPGRITRPVQPVPPTDEPLQSEVQDLDGDGDPDLAVTLTSYWRNQGDGTTVPSAPVLPAPPAGSTWLGPGYLGDFSGDGLVDFLVERWEDATFGGVHLLVNMGGEVFVDAGMVCLPAEPFSSWTTLAQDNCLVADFDSNGTLDLAVRRPRHTLPEYRPMRTDLWLNDGLSSFTPVPTWDEQRILAVGEFSNDGLNDVIVFHNEGLQPGFRVRYGLPGGGWDEPRNLTQYGAFAGVSAVQLWRDRFAVADALSSFPSEGVDDFIAYQRGQRYAKVARGQTGGFWTYTSDLRLWLEDEGPWFSEQVRYGVQLADLDGDGIPGYLINTPRYALESTWTGPGRVRLLRDPDPRLDPALPCLRGGRPGRGRRRRRHRRARLPRSPPRGRRGRRSPAVRPGLARHERRGADPGGHRALPRGGDSGGARPRGSRGPDRRAAREPRRRPDPGLPGAWRDRALRPGRRRLRGGPPGVRGPGERRGRPRGHGGGDPPGELRRPDRVPAGLPRRPHGPGGPGRLERAPARFRRLARGRAFAACARAPQSP